MHDAILVINSGSSSIKFAVYLCDKADDLHCCFRGQVSDIGTRARLTVSETDLPQQPTPQSPDHAQALQYIFDWLAENSSDLNLTGVGHRVVHGGRRFTRSVRVDGQVLDALTALVPLAPLHQPHALHAIDALQRQQPQLVQVACFDTAFHADMPDHEQRFAIPRALEQQGIRRYGFHGLSYEYIASVLPEYLGERANGKVVVAHLGHGVSMCAMRQRRSIATTMSFTPLDGLPMARRSGAIDPAIVLYLLDQGMPATEIGELLHRRSGLLGMSGISDDMQTLLASEEPAAAEAIGYFCYRIGRELGSLAAALAGLDALVFTGGIGERAAPVRAQICEAANWLGVRIDEQANQRDAMDITARDSQVAVRVIPTDEESIIARHTLTTIRGS